MSNKLTTTPSWPRSSLFFRTRHSSNRWWCTIRHLARLKFYPRESLTSSDRKLQEQQRYNDTNAAFVCLFCSDAEKSNLFFCLYKYLFTTPTNTAKTSMKICHCCYWVSHVHRIADGWNIRWQVPAWMANVRDQGVCIPSGCQEDGEQDTQVGLRYVWMNTLTVHTWYFSPWNYPTQHLTDKIFI